MKLAIQELVKKYGKKEVLTGASYEFEEGKIYSVLGRNGAGKTTLFSCINADVAYESGHIWIEKDGRLQNPEYDDIGIVSASPVLPDFLTGYEFVSFFAKLNNAGDEQIVDKYFDIVRIDEPDRHRLLKNYSYGMKNKVQLLCCLIKNPKVILLDEPLSSFDVVVSHDIKELLMDMKSDHIILMSTHIMQLAKDVSDEIVILSDGKLLRPDAPELKDEEFKRVLLEELAD